MINAERARLISHRHSDYNAIKRQQLMKYIEIQVMKTANCGKTKYTIYKDEISDNFNHLLNSENKKFITEKFSNLGYLVRINHNPFSNKILSISWRG